MSSRLFSLLCLAGTFSPFVLPVTAQTASKSRELATQLQHAEAALKINDQAGASEAFRAALRLDPSNAEAHANLGVIAFYHGDCPTAVPEIQSAIKTEPSLAKPQALLAVCERRLGMPAAQTDLEKSFESLIDVKLQTQVGIELADLYYQRGDLAHTATVLHTLSDLSPDNAEILFFEQRVYSELADDTLNKLALLAPGSARMEQLIAERLINAADLKGAIVHYRKALKLNPGLPGVHFELAESLMEGSPNAAEAQKEASSQLDEAVKFDGDSSRVESEMGRIALLQSDPNRALNQYRRALALNPGDAQAEIGLAGILADQNKPEEAAKYLRLAIAVDPLNAEAHYRLSNIARTLHLEEEQKKELKLFLEIRATKDEVKELLRQMNPQPEGASVSEPTVAKP